MPIAASARSACLERRVRRFLQRPDRAPSPPTAADNPGSAARRADRCAADPRAIGGWQRGLGRLRARRQPVLQFEPDPLGGLLADAGDLGQPRDVLRADRPNQIAGSMPDSTASASFGPIPLIAISRSNRSCSSGVAKPNSAIASSRTWVWTRRLTCCAGLAEHVERRERHLHVVADAADVDDHAARCLLDQRAAERCNHWIGGAVSRGPVGAPRARVLAAAAAREAGRPAGRTPMCRWQIATASASAASCGDGDGVEAEQQLDHLLDLVLLRAAVADDRALDLGRRVLDDRQARFRRREQRDAARVSELERAPHVARVEDVLDRDAVGPMVRRAALRARRGSLSACRESRRAAGRRERSADDEAVTAADATRRSRSPCARSRDRSRRSSRQRGLDLLLFDVGVRPHLLGVVVLLEQPPSA